jgi:hypothetical protein
MKLCKILKIDQYETVIGFSSPQIDPIKTERAIKKAGIRITEQNRKQLMNEYAVYFENSTDEFIKENKVEILKEKLKNLKDDEKLCIDGSIIKDCRGKTNYKKVNGKWKEEIIDKIGIVPQKTELNEVEQKEFQDQIEEERLEKLSPEDIQKEKEIQIDNLARQALEKEGIMRIKGEKNAEATAKSWFESEKVKIESKYNKRNKSK